MERRFRVRLDELLDDADVPPGLLRGVLPRLQTFLRTLLAALHIPEQQTNAQHYVQGLLSDLDSKDVESIAYLHDRERQGLQKFIGQADWDHQPLLTELVRQVGSRIGRGRRRAGLRPLGLPQAGQGVRRRAAAVVRPAGQDRQLPGRHLPRLRLPARARPGRCPPLPAQGVGPAQTRRQKAGVPDGVRFRTRHELVLEMLDERGPLLPHAWISGDDEMGRCSWFRQQLRSRGECYLLAVPCNTLVRDLTAPDPPYGGRGRRPLCPVQRVGRWCAALPEAAWETVEVRDGEKGPLVVQVAWTLVQARTEGRVSDVAEWLVVFRERQGDGTWKHDYLLSNAPLATPVAEFARVFKAQHRIEECLKRAKGEAGLADYQVRTWEGWHHHQTLSLLATWFLTQETRRGKNADAGVDGAAGAGADRGFAERAFGLSSSVADSPHGEPPFASQRGGTALSLATT